MTVSLRILVILLLGLPLLTGCSGDQEKKEKKEKSAIEQRTDKVAQEAVERIKVPLEQANKAAELENIRNQQFEEVEKKQ